MKTSTQRTVLLSEIAIHDQVRTTFDEVELIELTGSINQQGVIQPIALNEKNGKLHLVCGERRYRGSMGVMKGYTDSEGKKIPAQPTRDKIPANIFKDLTDDEVLDMQITENLQRVDPHPMNEAAAYKKMLDQRKWGVKEVAARVGRTDKYVGLRIKLNNLIPEWQKTFYEDRIDMRDAIEISKLATEGQTELFKEEGKKKEISISEWDINKHKRKLKEAPFDIKDGSLIKAMGPCTSCPNNTAANVLLFPEESGSAMCMNKKCFDLKCDLSINAMIKKAKEDPSMIFVCTEYYSSDNEIMKKLKASGDKVYARDTIEIVTKPSKADIDSGKVHKAFCVKGNQFGLTIHVKIKKSDSKPEKGSAGAFKEKMSEGKVSAADIDAEITRIKSTEERKQEIDMEKAWPEIHKLLAGNKKFLGNELALSVPEKIATILLLHDKIPYHFSWVGEDEEDDNSFWELNGFGGDSDGEELVEWLIKKASKLDAMMNRLCRAFFYSNIPAIFRTDSSNNYALDLVIAGYDAPGVKNIMDEVELARKKRAERIDSTITGLKEKKKILSVPAPKTKMNKNGTDLELLKKKAKKKK